MSSLWKRTFYVDAVNGSDSNPGHQEDKAWKTLARVNREILRPGDKVCLRRGCRWDEVLKPQGDGDFNARIVIEGYGEGDKPWVAGDSTYASVFLDGVSFYIVDGLKVSNHAEERAIRSGICIRGKALGITEGITVTNCEIFDVTGENRRAMGPYKSMYYNSGIYVTFPGRTSEKNHLHDILIQGNHVHDVLTSGIRVNQIEDGLVDIHHTHIVVRGNLIERTGADAIIVANSISPLIMGNRCFHAGALGNLKDTQLIAGVWVCATENALIARNEVAYTRKFEADGSAFDTDWGTAGDTVFQYNVSYKNEGGFWLDCINLNQNPECGKTILRYNVSIGDEDALTREDKGLPTEIYGNYFGGLKQMPSVCSRDDGASHAFYDNIFDYEEAPADGWKNSHYCGNWYGNLTDLPDDPDPKHGLPFQMPKAEDIADEDIRKVYSEYCTSLSRMIKTKGQKEQG